MKHAPRVVKIEKRTRETATVVSFVVKDADCAKAKPGEFAMIWVPGVDEIPMSIFPVTRGAAFFAVRIVGEATRCLARRRVGDMIGVRGPYGTFFTPRSKGAQLLVGGGTGILPLASLMRSSPEVRMNATFVVGANTKPELFFLDWIRKVSGRRSRIVVATDDGTGGIKGLASEVAADLCNKNLYGQVYACGPEQMIRSLFDLCEKKDIPLQASLDRIMKCGVGLCGSCCIGRYRVCTDGPVFQPGQLREVVDELGLWRRSHSGKIVRI